MEIGQLTALSLAALVITSGATVAIAVPGGAPLQFAPDSDGLDRTDVEREGSIHIAVEGNVTAGNNVTLTATDDGEPVRFAPVSVDGDTGGETDENGSITVTVPDEDEFEVEIEAEREGELAVPLAEDESGDGDAAEMEDGDEGTEADEEDDMEETAADDEERLDLTYDGNVTAGENVTITATHEDYGVPGAAVSVNGEYVGETDENGSIAVTVPDEAEFEVEAEYEAEGELAVPLAGGGEDDVGDETDEAEHEEDGYVDLIVDGTLDPGANVTVTALYDGEPVENAAVEVNDETVGQTDGSGEFVVTVPQDEEFELEVSADDREAEMTVDFEEAEEVEEGDTVETDDEDDNDEDDNEADDHESGEDSDIDEGEE